MTRRRLPDRRPCEHVDFEHNGVMGTVTVGFRLPDLTPAEIFLHAAKIGTAIEVEARDAGIAVSVALQHGASLDDLQHSLTKNDDGRPVSILGAAIASLKGGSK
jgi:hypothetical protein